MRMQHNETEYEGERREASKKDNLGQIYSNMIEPDCSAHLREKTEASGPSQHLSHPSRQGSKSTEHPDIERPRAEQNNLQALKQQGKQHKKLNHYRMPVRLHSPKHNTSMLATPVRDCLKPSNQEST